MKFESKISGTMVTGFDITPIFNTVFISLNDCVERLHRQESMNYVLDTYRFTLGNDGGWYAIISMDDDCKLAILENYPDYEQEMVEYFGDGWLKHYIRFNH